MAPHDNEARWKNADLTFEGRRSGMNMHCSDGEYIGFCVTPDDTGIPVHCKMNINQALVFAKSILAAIK